MDGYRFGKMKKQSASFAKVTLPSLTRIYHRTRLFKRIDQSCRKPLIWVTGPGGCGKTTLVSSYVQSRALSCLWYQVDPGDADPATFFYYLGLAAKKVAPRYKKSLPLLTPEYLPGLDVFTLRFFEKLYQRVKSPGLVVLDNLQELPDDSAPLKLLVSSLSLLPERTNVILISRNHPPPLLARLQANRQMRIVDYRDLRLTLGETENIARLHLGKKLPQKTAKILHQRSEGWAAGLMLMMETGHLRRSTISAKDLETPEVVFDYFATEVLDQLPKNIQDFLLITALGPTVSSHLAKALTGVAGAPGILSRLSRENYFITRHSGKAATYQYHPLFKEFLNKKAEATLPRKNFINLQRKTAALLEKEGAIEAAAELSIRTADWERLAVLTMNHAPLILSQGRFSLLNIWLGHFPEKWIQRTPWLLYWQGVANLFMDPAASRQSLEAAYHLFKSGNDPVGMLVAWAGIIDAIEFQVEDLSAMDEWLSEFDHLTDSYQKLDEPEIQTQVACSMLRALTFRQPQHPDFDTWLKRALQPPRDALTANKTAHMLCMLLLHYFMGTAEIAKAEKTRIEAEKLLELPFVTPYVRLAVKVIEAIFYVLTGDHDRCRQAVTEGLKLGRETGILLYEVGLTMYYIADLLNTNEIELVQKHLHDLGGFIESSNSYDKTFYYFMKARTALAVGELNKARIHAETALGMARKLGIPVIACDAHILYGFILHASGHPQKTEAQLEKADELIRRHHVSISRLYYLLAKAYFTLEQGQTDQGLKGLQKGFAYGQKIGLLPLFLDHPAATAKLCVTALENNIEVDYARKIIQTRHLTCDPPPLHLDNWPWPIQIQAFGRFNLVVDDQPVRFSRKAQQKPLDLLKMIVALGGQNVNEARITDELWPHADGDKAHQAFATTLHRLRKLIQYPQAILFTGGRVSLDSQYIRIDTHAFDQMVNQLDAIGPSLPKSAETQKRIRLARQAIAIYQGPFLSDESWAACFISQRERFSHRFQNLITQLGDDWAADGQWEHAIACYRQGLDKEPLTETFYQRLMVCHANQGQHSEALKVYDRCKKMLSQVSDRAPSQSTQTVYKTLLN